MRLVSAHRGSTLRNHRPTCVRRFVPCCCIPTRVRRFVPCCCIPTRVRRSVPRCCIPMCVRRSVPRCCIPTRVRRSVLPPTDTHAPPRPVLHFPLSAAAQLAAFHILETFPFIGKKMRAVALGSFRIAWKRFHFSITVYYRFLILSTLFSNFFSILFTQPYSPPPFTRYPCCGTTIIPSFFCTATAVFRAGGGRRSCFRKSGARGGSPLA